MFETSQVTTECVSIEEMKEVRVWERDKYCTQELTRCQMKNGKSLVTFLELSFKETGTGNSNASEVNQVEQKVGLAEEGSFPGTEVEQESVGTLEARSG